jgi:acetylornithine aminotransferase
MPTYGRLPVAFIEGKGAVLFDEDRKAYLDGLSGIAVTNLGHGHPAVTEAITRQAQTLIHTSNLYRILPQERLAQRLCDLTGMESVFFCNSGAEANEAAIKLARLYGHQRGIEQPEIIVLSNSFHGRTLAALAATGNDKIKTGFGPLPAGFTRVERGNIEAVRQLQSNPNVVAVLLEPVQGEGGVYALPKDYLMALRALCDEAGWLLMFDEVQSGNGRCGSLYAFLQLGVVPDVLTTAKGLGNGVPIGACMARGNAAKTLGPGDHGTTYGGNFLACAAAHAVIETLEQEQLYQRVAPLRTLILEHFQQNLKYPNAVTDIRGLGLMIGIELALPCTEVVATALQHGLLVNITAGNTLRLLPPMIMTDEQAATLGKGVAAVVDIIAAQQEDAR